MLDFVQNVATTLLLCYLCGLGVMVPVAFLGRDQGLNGLGLVVAATMTGIFAGFLWSLAAVWGVQF